MPYYHRTKEDALNEGKRMFEEDWCVNAQLEPNNGWVIVLSPLTMSYLTKPLEPILAFAEVRISHTIRRRPEGHVKPPKRVEGGNPERRKHGRRRRSSRDVPPPSAPPPLPKSIPTSVAPAAPPPLPKLPGS